MDDSLVEPYYNLLPLDLLRDHPDNYKKHPPEQLETLKKSLLRFGQVRPVVVRQIEPDKYILLAGHGITQAARALLVEKPNLPRVAGWRKHWACIIVPPDWTAEQARAYLVADNELSRRAENDLQQLAALLEEQRNLDEDLAALGYTSEELNQLLDGLASEILDEDDQVKRERSKELAEPEGGEVGEVYNVVVECASENEQQRAYDLLTEEGFTCHLNTL